MRSCCKWPRIEPGANRPHARHRTLTQTPATHRYGIAQKEQLGFDKAVEVRPTPPQPLHLLPCHYHERHSPPSDSLPWQECKYRASTAASNHTTTPLDARPVADRVPPRVHRHVALRRHAQHARHAAAGWPCAATTQQRPCVRLTRMRCLCADAALHGARP